MPLEPDLRTFLLNRIVGLRLYPDRLPQEPILPAVVYQRISTIPAYSHDGDARTDAIRVQISTFAQTRADADLLAQQIRTALSGFRGTLDTCAVGIVTLLNQVATFEPTSQYAVTRCDYRFGMT